MMQASPLIPETAAVPEANITLESPNEAAWTMALHWTLTHSLTSDVELARLTNVCRSWRRVVHEFLRQSSSSMLNSNDPSTIRTIDPLLLPSMVRQLLVETFHNKATDTTQEPLPLETVVETPMVEHFCAAWFPPEGIQALPVTLANDDEDEDMDDSNNNNGHPTRDWLDPTRFHSLLGHAVPGNRPTITAVNAPVVLCCPEWRGYRHPYDILQPFGYTRSFMHGLFCAVTDRMDISVNTTTLMSTEDMDPPRDELQKSNSEHSQPNNDDDWLLLDTPSYTQTTWAVRGATIARAESYCLCLDEDHQQPPHHSPRDGPLLTQSTDTTATALLTTTATSSLYEDLRTIRRQEQAQALLRRKRRRRELQRDVLPIIVPTVAPHAQQHQQEVANANDNYQRTLVFLNAEGKHACCMMTPLWACGPLAEPVTIVCVGIATEDGCFLSGLYHRFEFGHLYPADPVSEATQLSAVCLATESWEAPPRTHPPPIASSLTETRPYATPPQLSNTNVPLSSGGRRAEDSSVDDDDDDERGSSGFHCECMFDGVCEKLADMSMEEMPDKIHRGRTGPGAWHCYVAIFDGCNSTIRIDGHSEHPLQGEYVPSDPTKKAWLDGLTIGSDHCFSMSLCCGQGSSGEGEGAIAELAVFSGRLDILDIEALESALMQKHGIPHNDPPPWKDSEWERQAQALLYYPQTPRLELPIVTDNVSRGVPLQYLARHRAVSWKRTHPVSGLNAQILKIGSKPGASSSDW
jgi:hypothetical protein